MEEEEEEEEDQQQRQALRKHQKEDETTDEVIQNLPQRDRKNAAYIFKKMSKNGEGRWSEKGEFVYKGKVINGSHMMDLIKHLSSSYKKSLKSEPKGWSGFLNTLSVLNIPLSSVNNPHAREQYRRLRSEEEEEERGSKRKIVLSPKWSTPMTERYGGEEEEKE